MLYESHLFTQELQSKIRDQFNYVNWDPFNGERIYFENSGGSLTLRSVAETAFELTKIPDATKRPSASALYLKNLVDKGKQDIRFFLGLKEGVIFSSQTASRMAFHIVGTIIQNIPGDNVVTTDLEHPSNYDACAYYAAVHNKELRVARVNQQTGGVDVDEILSLIDSETCVISVMIASNITGAVIDYRKLVTEARKIKPDLFIVLDATQHVAHGLVDLDELNIDGLFFTTYKIFAKRGLGIGYVSDRVASLPHERNLEKNLTEWEIGSVEPAGYVCWSCVIDYLLWLGSQFIDSTDKKLKLIEAMNRIHWHETAMLELMLWGDRQIKGLMDIEGVTVHFVKRREDLLSRDFVLPITVKDQITSEVVKKYQQNGVIVFDRVRTNSMSRRTLDAFGIPGLIRVSPNHYNSPEEIKTFLEITKKICEE